jgi:hypothetical protein
MADYFSLMWDGLASGHFHYRDFVPHLIHHLIDFSGLSKWGAVRT